MIADRVETPATDYYSARSRTPSVDSRRSDLVACLAPLPSEGRKSIGISLNPKRQYKDKRIYVNPRTGLPVRPPTSFGLFKHAMRRHMKDGKVNFHEFNKKSNEQWKKMSDNEKEPYIERARNLAHHFKEVERSYLRKKLRSLQDQIKEYRRAVSQNNRGNSR